MSAITPVAPKRRNENEWMIHSPLLSGGATDGAAPVEGWMR